MNAAGDLTQLVRDACQPSGDPRQRALELAELWRQRRLHRAQLQAERDEPLPDAVLQIALDLPSRIVGSRHDAGP